MAIPKQVQQQHELAVAMMRGEAGAQPTEKTENEAPTPESTSEDQASSEGQSTQEQVGEAAGFEANESAPAEGQDLSSELNKLREQLEKSEQRYRSLDGMIRQKDATIRKLETLIAQMQTTQPAAEQKQEIQKPQSPPADEVKDRSEFGDDLVDMVYRAIDRRLAAIESRLASVENVAKETHAEATSTRQARFFEALDARVPGWREIDKSEEFTQWLHASPSRVEYVKQGMARLDVDAIAEIFELYKVVSGTGRAQDADAPAKPSLGKKVAPSKGVSNTAAPAEKRAWRRSEIIAVYQNRRKYSQKEFDRLQREIFAAQREGRVDYTK